jgi:outer membrane protein assembly factor BamB
MVWTSEPGKQIKEAVTTSGSEHATPVIYDYKGIRSAAIFNSQGLCSVDVESGKQQWFFDWKPYYRVSVADPIVFNDNVFMSCGYDIGCVLIDISGNEPQEIWRNKNMLNHWSTGVLIDGNIYGIDGSYKEDKSLNCIDFKTGEKMWSENLKAASLSAAVDKLIILNDKGTFFIVEATPSAYKEISSGTIPDQKGFELWWAPPVLLRGRIYCRSSDGGLYCIDVSK